MIAGRDFIVLSDDWHGLPTSAGHLFRLLARSNRIFWLNVVGRLPRLSLADARKVCRTARGWMGLQSQRATPPEMRGSAGVRVSNPLVIPYFKPLVRRWNRRSMWRTYKNLRAAYDIQKPIFVTTFPYTVDFFKALDGPTKLYYCVDDFLDYPGVNHADWARMENELLGCIDGLMVTSRTLAEKNLYSRPLLHLPHGVDFEHFQASPATDAIERRMQAIRQPIVGFFGLISSWVDLGIVRLLSIKFPHCSFVLIGRAEVGVQELLGRPNIHYLGPVPYADLPHYAHYFRVGLIPFVISRLTKAVNPLKLLEYYALGLPVVSTRLPELEQLPGPLHLATTPDDFCSGLNAALNRTAGASDEAMTIARANTWAARVEQLSQFIEELQFAEAPASQACPRPAEILPGC